MFGGWVNVCIYCQIWRVIECHFGAHFHAFSIRMLYIMVVMKGLLENDSFNCFMKYCRVDPSVEGGHLFSALGGKEGALSSSNYRKDYLLPRCTFPCKGF